jgi:hypothetical protein
MAITAVGNSQIIQNFTLGDDVIAFVQAVQFMQADTLGSNVATAAEAVRLQTDRVNALRALRDKLAALPNNGNDDKTKLLGDPTEAEDLQEDVQASGESLAALYRYQVSTETTDASGKTVSSEKKLAGTGSVIQSLSGFTLVSSEPAGQLTYAKTENAGTKDEVTTQIVWNLNEGEVTASADAVAALLETIEGRTQVEADKLSASQAALATLIDNLDECIVVGDDKISEARQRENHLDEVRLEDRRLQEAIDRTKNNG